MGLLISGFARFDGIIPEIFKSPIGPAYGIARCPGPGQSPAVDLAAKIPWLNDAPRGKRWLVGVSGGADSVALLHLLLDAGFRNLVVCHLDHQLRGSASTADANFVLRMCAKLGVPCECARSDVRKRMAASGDSMETAARNARHEFFSQCAVKQRCRRILLAHHADDQAETVLWNLLRGSHGLKGMRGEQSITMDGIRMRVVRPLLGLRHAQLMEWLKQRGHAWREDASNRQPVTIRNRLRNEVFPLLAEISGRDPVNALVRAAADSAAREEMEAGWLNYLDPRDPQGRLHLPVLRELPPVIQRAVVRNYLTDHGVPRIDRPLLDASLGLLDLANAPVINLPGGRRLRRSGGRLWMDRSA